MKRLTVEEVEREIAALDGLDLKTLQDRWRELYKVEPPFKVRSGFLRRAIAYRLQELVFGGLSAKTRRELKAIAEDAGARRRSTIPDPTIAGAEPARSVTAPRRRALSPGTRLLREWNGSTEIVDVLVGGFGWRGKTYRTLSAVAVAITGTKWSGPKFFGLIGGSVGKATKPREPELLALGHSEAVLTNYRSLADEAGTRHPQRLETTP